MAVFKPSPSPYLDQFPALKRRYPVLKAFDENLYPPRRAVDLQRQRCIQSEFRNSLNGFPGRAAVIEFPDAQNASIPKFRDLSDINELNSYLRSNQRNCRRRLFILEDLALPFVEAFGHLLDVDPRIFAYQIRAVHWDNPWKGFQRTLRATQFISDTSEERTDFFNLRYYNVRRIEDREKVFGPKGNPYWNRLVSVTQRHFEPGTKTKRIITPIKGAQDDVKYEYNIGLIRANASLWTKTMVSSSGTVLEDGLFLVDPPMRNRAFVKPKTSSMGNIGEVLSFPYQGGFPDPRPLFPGDWRRGSKLRGPSRECLFDDLRFYLQDSALWTKVNESFPNKSLQAIASFYLKMLIAAHWNALLNHLFASISCLEFDMTDIEAKLTVRSNRVEEQKTWAYIEEDIYTMNTLRRRMNWYIEQMDENIYRLGIDPEAIRGLAKPQTLQEAIDKDFIDIADRLRVYKDAIDALMGIAGNIAGIRQAKKALVESHYVELLTVVGLVVFPLTFLCSVFSMGGDFGPGQPLFWLYWVIGIPLVLVILIILQLTKTWDRQKEANFSQISSSRTGEKYDKNSRSAESWRRQQSSSGRLEPDDPRLRTV